MKIPSKTECFELIREMEMFEHIVAHSIQVCRVSLLLVDELLGVGVCLDRALVQAGALLHDITKTRSFETGEMHAETGARLLAERGFPEVGDIVRQHVILDCYFASPVLNEAEIVNYADKRVMHDRVVSLDRRMRYIRDRYARSRELRSRLERLWIRSAAMETRIFTALPFSQTAVKHRVPPAELATEMQTYLAVCSG